MIAFDFAGSSLERQLADEFPFARAERKRLLLERERADAPGYVVPPATVHR